MISSRLNAVTTLSDFKVVLTASRARAPAAGYGNRSRLLAIWQPLEADWQKAIGKSSGWSWHSVQACSLKTTRLKDNTASPSPPVVRLDSIKVSLLITCHPLLPHIQQTLDAISPLCRLVTARGFLTRTPSGAPGARTGRQCG